VHRIATSSRYRVSPREVRASWSWREVLEAHLVLDAFDDAETEAAKRR
jgi:hypothetical protein